MPDPITTPTAEPTPTPATPGYAPLRGITRTLPEAPITQPASIRSSVLATSLTGAFFVAALMPPIALLLTFGLTGRIGLLPYTPAWAWGAALLALLLTLRAGLNFMSSRRASAGGSLAATAALLAIPATFILVLVLRNRPITQPLAIAQIVMYAICTCVIPLGTFNPNQND